MRARCEQCRRMWCISIQRRIPRAGYICPQCAGKKKSRYSGCNQNNDKDNLTAISITQQKEKNKGVVGHGQAGI